MAGWPPFRPPGPRAGRSPALTQEIRPGTRVPGHPFPAYWEIPPRASFPGRLRDQVDAASYRLFPAGRHVHWYRGTRTRLEARAHPAPLPGHSMSVMAPTADAASYT
jgi:hypothetical protein